MTDDIIHFDDIEPASLVIGDKRQGITFQEYVQVKQYDPMGDVDFSGEWTPNCGDCIFYACGDWAVKFKKDGTVELNVDKFTPAEAAEEFVKTVADVWRRLNGK